jgi:hypothetical protein
MVHIIPEGLRVFVCRHRPAPLEWLSRAGWYPGKRKNNVVSVVIKNVYLIHTHFLRLKKHR